MENRRRQFPSGLGVPFSSLGALPVLLLALACGCQSFRPAPWAMEKNDKEPPPPPATPTKNSLRVSQFYFHADFELKADLPLFKELEALRDQIYKELQLPAANTIVQVNIFEDRNKYERFMKARYPELPKRRAFFVAQPRSVGAGEDLLVFTYWGDRVQMDLRHELTHALLHSVLKDVPLWLDEGLAEYYEVPPGWKGLNAQHLDHLRQSGFKADLNRLEQLGQVQQMTPADYREAWAWVHMMIQGPPEAKTVLLAYLQQLRANPNPGPLGPRLAEAVPQPDDAVRQHFERINVPTPRPPTAQK